MPWKTLFKFGKYDKGMIVSEELATTWNSMYSKPHAAFETNVKSIDTTETKIEVKPKDPSELKEIPKKSRFSRFRKKK